MEGRIVLDRRSIVRPCLVAWIAWSLVAALVPFAAAGAEPGIPPGSSAVITAGQPVLVRVSPGWDAGVAYQLDNGSPITVWDVEQAATDGSLWYPIDGGFVPADAVTSLAASDPSAASPVDATSDMEVPADAAFRGTAAAPDAAPESMLAPGQGVMPPAPESWGQPIGTATIGDTGGAGAACQAAPASNSQTLTVFGDGDQVEIRGDAVGGWQPVNCAGAGGYVNTSLLSTPLAVAAVAPPDAPALGGGVPPANGGVSTGERIADFALQFQGIPYVYAGEGPYAFDCSGFTMFVINQTLGLDIPHDMTQQFAMGQPVSRDTLQPGDLVFFANTLHPGMSHNGIYIGGGKFVHAENEGAGVKVSDLDNDYYSSRWYGAVRFS
jgi:peptidoglycan DL-endopeptidase CwlO